VKVYHSVKFQLNRQYEMHTFSMELDDSDFPELAELSIAKRTRVMQGTLIQNGLAFQVATGYITPNSPEFQEAWRLAAELKTLTPPEEES
jgi:hypothetical protein